jgi:hypothetical protein
MKMEGMVEISDWSCGKENHSSRLNKSSSTNNSIKVYIDTVTTQVCRKVSVRNSKETSLLDQDCVPFQSGKSRTNVSVGSTKVSAAVALAVVVLVFAAGMALPVSSFEYLVLL